MSAPPPGFRRPVQSTATPRSTAAAAPARPTTVPAPVRPEPARRPNQPSGPAAPQHDGGSMVIAATVCVAVPIVASIANGLRDTLPQPMLYLMCWLMVILAGNCVWSWRHLTGRWFDAYNLTFVALWMFNGGGIALRQVMNPDVEAILEQFKIPVFQTFEDRDVTIAYYLVILCLSAFHVAALATIRPVDRRSLESNRPASAPPDYSMRRIGFMLLAVSAVPTIMMLNDSIQKVRTGGYMALYQNMDENSSLFQLASGLVPGAFYLLASSTRSPFYLKLAQGIILAFSCVALGLGTRGVFFQNIAALMWLRHFAIKPIPRWMVIGGIFGGMMLSTLVFWSRNIASDTGFSLDSVIAATSEASNGVDYALNETGMSLITVVYVVDLVPFNRDFEYGFTYFRSVVSVLPFIKLGERGEFEGHWLIGVVSPATEAVGGGIGFSLIAEAFLNFGWAGPLAMAVMGALLGRFSCWCHIPGYPQRLAFAACLLSMALMGARGSTLTFSRKMIALCLVPYCMMEVSRKPTSRVLPQHQQPRRRAA